MMLKCLLALPCPLLSLDNPKYLETGAVLAIHTVVFVRSTELNSTQLNSTQLNSTQLNSTQLN
jgi:hypothetical protein